MLKKQRVDITGAKNASNFLFFSPETITNTQRAPHVFFHEFGHSLSNAAGLGTEGSVAKGKMRRYISSLSEGNISGSRKSGVVDTLLGLHAEAMGGIGAEEARADSIGLLFSGRAKRNTYLDSISKMSEISAYSDIASWKKSYEPRTLTRSAISAVNEFEIDPVAISTFEENARIVGRTTANRNYHSGLTIPEENRVRLTVLQQETHAATRKSILNTAPDKLKRFDSIMAEGSSEFSEEGRIILSKASDNLGKISTSVKNVNTETMQQILAAHSSMSPDSVMPALTQDASTAVEAIIRSSRSTLDQTADTAGAFLKGLGSEGQGVVRSARKKN